ncbi:FAD-dependent monooxygenase [Luedemannella helvata]|uniref:FAD-dependent oxidoreductase n=1 Tax=Luedemannella helvata TaxID=349315 RepID=A0ABN2KX72_9ACTN
MSDPINHDPLPVLEVPVLIAGGGPVGLSLATELARRGIESAVIETRESETEHPKATLVGARTMELFRRWGIADAVEDAAIPPDHPYFIVFATELAKHELHRFRSASRVEMRGGAGSHRFPEVEWSPYGKTQIGQQALEPILRAHLAGYQAARTLYGWTLTGFTQDESGVDAVVEHRSGARQRVRARVLVGCDGGRSLVRKALGVRFVGRGPMRDNVSFLFRCPDFIDVHGRGLANLYFTLHPDSFGVFTAIDGSELWNYQYYFLDPEKSTRDLDVRDVLAKAVGKPFDFELLKVTHWKHFQSVANRWRVGNVFLAGDAAHLFVPTGGLGMNTGIGDAWDLAWKLEGHLNGWAGEHLLDSYEAERKPIAIRNGLLSAMNSDRLDIVMAETDRAVLAPGPEGEAARTELRAKAEWVSRQFNSAGLHLGYRYSRSPICVPDGTPEPPDDPTRVIQSSWPGCRAPHAWDGDGVSTLDRLGNGFTLVVAPDADEAPAEPLLSAARAAGLPVTSERLRTHTAAARYERRYVLVRPDGHVAWRGDTAPERPDEVVDVIRGARRSPLPGTPAPDRDPVGSTV